MLVTKSFWSEGKITLYSLHVILQKFYFIEIYCTYISADNIYKLKTLLYVWISFKLLLKQTKFIELVCLLFLDLA